MNQNEFYKIIRNSLFEQTRSLFYLLESFPKSERENIGKHIVRYLSAPFDKKEFAQEELKRTLGI